MKLTTTIAAVTLAVGSMAAHAGDLAANAQVRDYLIQSGLMSEPFSADRVARTRPARDIEPSTAYLADSGLIEPPTVEVIGGPLEIDFADAYTDDKRVENLLVDWGLLSRPLRAGMEGDVVAGSANR